MFEPENVEARESKTQGRGVFANKDFQKGDVVLQIDDTHVVKDKSKLTAGQHELELDYLADKTVIMQEPEKYINHSCEPNTYVKTNNGVREVLAMRDIKLDKNGRVENFYKIVYEFK